MDMNMLSISSYQPKDLTKDCSYYFKISMRYVIEKVLIQQRQ